MFLADTTNGYIGSHSSSDILIDLKSFTQDCMIHIRKYQTIMSAIYRGTAPKKSGCSEQDSSQAFYWALKSLQKNHP